MNHLLYFAVLNQSTNATDGLNVYGENRLCSERASDDKSRIRILYTLWCDFVLPTVSLPLRRTDGRSGQRVTVGLSSCVAAVRRVCVTGR